MLPAPGTMVGSHVRLTEPLGRGGMGSVWAGEHLGLGAPVAVKLVDPERLAATPALRERLRREASVAAQLDSPHALRIHGHGETDDGTPFIVMERLVGETLAARIQRDGPLSIRDVAAIVTQLAGVLARAHELGFVHRDLKPENVFLLAADYDVFVKLLDFGVVKDLRGEHDLTTTGSILGTPQYMAPEQLLGSADVDARADVWGLGAVAYAALGGRRPFEGSTLAALSVAICNGHFTPLSELVADLPPALDAWFGRSVSVSVADRFPTIRAQARAFLEAAGLSGADVGPRPSEARSDEAGDAEGAQSRDRDESRVELPTAPSTFGGTSVEAQRPRGRRLALGALAAAAGLAVLAGVALGTGSWSRGAAATAGTDSPAAQPAPAPGPADAISEGAGIEEPPRPAGSTSPEPSVGGAPKPAPHASARTVPARAPGPAASHPVDPAVSRTARPAYCDTEGGFALDDRGYLRPRPECL